MDLCKLILKPSRIFLKLQVSTLVLPHIIILPLQKVRGVVVGANKGSTDGLVGTNGASMELPFLP